MNTKTRNPILALVAGIFLGCALLPAAQAQSGSIEGRVQNEVTGRYLNNAEITVQGTNLRVLTDEFGGFRLNNVPSGNVVLNVFYTGLEPRDITLQVQAGGTVRREINLSPPGTTAIQLDAFTVEAAKLTDQDTIAINEQRFAPNIKTVVATGDISEQPDGNVAEFLKMLPGVATQGGGTVPSAIYIRGFPPNMTQIMVDGVQVPSTTFGSPSRQVQTSNDTPGTGISRLEVTKVPTPATGADTMAGSVNMVSRTAFEASRSIFTYQVSVSGVLQQIAWGKRETGWEDDQWLLKPGFSFRYTNPISDNFGISISASVNRRQRPQEQIRPFYNYNSSTFGASPSAPVVWRAQYGTGSAIFDMANLQLKTDWRVTPESVLSAGFETLHWRGLTESFRQDYRAGSNATPTVAGGVPGSYGPDFTIGATGRGQANYSNSFNNNNKASARGNLRYTYDDGDWKMNMQGAYGKTRYWRTDDKSGNFSGLTVSPIRGNHRMEFHDIDPGGKGPETILVFDNDENPIDLYAPDVHNETEITEAQLHPRWGSTVQHEYKMDLTRRIDTLPFPASVQVGGMQRVREQDWLTKSTRWTYNGPDGDQSPAPFVTFRSFTRGEPSWATDAVPVVSPVLAHEAWQNNTSLFYQTEEQVIRAVRERRSSARLIEETAQALYFQVNGRFLNDRLNVLTGVRYERTEGEGEGPLRLDNAVWERNADGSFALDADGERIRRPEAGEPGSMEEVLLVYQERGGKGARTYDGYYPSVHFTYDISRNFLARLAYARTYGRPDFGFIIPNTRVRESVDFDTGEVEGGRLDRTNPGLIPWTANNYDLSLEYYTNQGGAFTAGVFHKDVKNFFSDIIRPASELDLIEAGLDPNSPAVASPELWEVHSTINAGDTNVTGFEVSMRHSLRPLDPWLGGLGQNFHFFANVTKLQIKRGEGLSGFLPLGVNGSLRFSKNPFVVSVSVNHRSKEILSNPTNIGPNGRRIRPPRTHVDLAVSFNLRRNLDLFFNVRNLTNFPVITHDQSDVLPAYATRGSSLEFGSVFNAGIKGSF